MMIGGLIGAVSGILLASFAMSAYGVSTSALTWSDLSNIASFWNGHLGSIALLLLALSLYYQARQLAAQTAAERMQMARFRHELCRTSLDLLVARLGELGNALRAHLVNSQSIPLQVQTFSGLQPFLAAVEESNRGTDDFEVWIEMAPLAAYVEASNKIAHLCKEMLELDSNADLPDVYRSHSEQRLRNYASARRMRQLNQLRRLRAESADETAMVGLSSMLAQGWEIDSFHSVGRFFMKARRFTVTFNRIDTLSADNCAAVQEACTRLVQQWHQRYE